MQLVPTSPPVSPSSFHLLVLPSTEVTCSGLDTKLPQNASAPCAMLLFSPKQHFDKSQRSLSPP